MDRESWETLLPVLMDKKIEATGGPAAGKSAEKADPLAQAKAHFDAALAKEKAERAGDVEAEPEPEAAPEKPAKKPKAEKAKAAPKPEADVESLTKQVKELSTKIAEREKPVEKKAEPAKDPMEAVKAYLAEQFGEDEAAALSTAFGSVLAPLLKRTEQMEQIIAEASKRGKDLASKSNRSRVGEKYEHLLKQDGAWKMVQAQAEALATSEPNKFETPEEYYDHVADTLYGEMVADKEPEEEDEVEEEAERVKASQMTNPSRSKAERKLSPEEKSKAIFDHLLKNPDDLAGAKKVARQLRVH